MLNFACPACPVGPADRTGVAPVDGTGVGSENRTGAPEVPSFYFFSINNRQS
jgi:hypothetical protein